MSIINVKGQVQKDLNIIKYEKGFKNLELTLEYLIELHKQLEKDNEKGN